MTRRVTSSGDPLWYAPSGKRDRPDAAFVGRRSLDRRAASPSRALAVHATTPLDPEVDPDQLLVGAYGTVVCGAGRCQLVDRQGRPSAVVGRGADGAALDSAGSHLIATNRPRTAEERGATHVYRVPDGALVGRVRLDALHFRAVQIHRFGELYLFCTVRPRPPHSREAPEAGALLVHMDGFDGREPGGEGELAAGRREGFIVSYGSSSVIADAGPLGIVLATDLGVQWTDWALRPTAQWRAQGRPHAVAVGPTNEVALVTVIDEEPQLVFLAADGTEQARAALPDSAYDGPASVFITDAEQTVVALPDRLFAYDAARNPAWALKRSGAPPATPLSDGDLLFEHDAGLWVANPAGKTRHLWQAPGPLATPAVAYRDAWYVASAEALYELR